MIKAVWNKQIIAASDHTIEIEGNQYFPKDSVIMKYLEDSSHKSTCPWKGEASYYSLNVDEKINENAVWYYPQPKEAAIEIKDHIAFWKGVQIISE